MFESFIEWMKGKHAPTGKTKDVLEALEKAKVMAKVEGRHTGLNQTQLGILIEEPEYVLRGMMDVLVDLHYVRMEPRGNSKMYYIID